MPQILSPESLELYRYALYYCKFLVIELSLLETGIFALVPITQLSIESHTRGQHRGSTNESKHIILFELSSRETPAIKCGVSCGRCA